MLLFCKVDEVENILYMASLSCLIEKKRIHFVTVEAKVLHDADFRTYLIG